MSEDELENQALRILFEVFPTRRALELLGYGLWFSFLGYQGPEDWARASDRAGGPARTSTYRALKDMQRLRQVLSERGVPVKNDQELADLIVSMGRRLPPERRAALAT